MQFAANDEDVAESPRDSVDTDHTDRDAEESSPQRPSRARDRREASKVEYISKERLKDALLDWEHDNADVHEAFKRELKCGLACIKHPRYVGSTSAESPIFSTACCFSVCAALWFVLLE